MKNTYALRKRGISTDLPKNPNDSELEYESNEEEFGEALYSEGSSDDEEKYFP
jgi:hypothetical protein